LVLYVANDTTKTEIGRINNTIQVTAEKKLQSMIFSSKMFKNRFQI